MEISFLKKGCEKPGALKLIACINFSSKRRIEMWRVIFEYVRLHNPSSTALPIMECADITRSLDDHHNPSKMATLN